MKRFSFFERVLEKKWNVHLNPLLVGVDESVRGVALHVPPHLLITFHFGIPVIEKRSENDFCLRVHHKRPRISVSLQNPWPPPPSTLTSCKRRRLIRFLGLFRLLNFQFLVVILSVLQVQNVWGKFKVEKKYFTLKINLLDDKIKFH